MYRITIPIYIVLITFSLDGFSQDRDNWRSVIQWNVSGFRDHNGGNAEVSSFFTSSPNTITWFQRKGSHKTEYQVLSRSGSWQDLEKEGQVEFRVSIDGNPGTIKFFRSKSQLGMRMKFDGFKAGPSDFEFSITSYEIR